MSRPSATVVLVHGAWHGAWCFAALQDALDQRGVPSYAIDLPGHGTSTAPLSDLHGDAAHVVAVLDRLAAPSVLVGHSYGGAVISHAAAGRADVGHLVYLAAFALYGGESVMGFLAGQPRAEVALSAAMRPGADGCSVLDPVAAVPALYGDCDAAAVAAAVAPVAPLVPEFDGPIENNGQVFSGGEVDITYCEILPDSGDTAATDGIDEFRIDVHPGTADLQIYLDEEWGGQASDAVESELLGGTVSSWCLDDDQCIAAWQGDGLFVAVVTMGVATATAADAVAALEAALPVVVAGLAA